MKSILYVALLSLLLLGCGGSHGLNNIGVDRYNKGQMQAAANQFAYCMTNSGYSAERQFCADNFALVIWNSDVSSVIFDGKTESVTKEDAVGMWNLLAENGYKGASERLTAIGRPVPPYKPYAQRQQASQPVAEEVTPEGMETLRSLGYLLGTVVGRSLSK